MYVICVVIAPSHGSLARITPIFPGTTCISPTFFLPPPPPILAIFLTSDGSYEELLQDPNVDIVYVGNTHSFRRSTGEKCLLANKHVLLEKPFACSVADAEYLIALAKERKRFIMEVMKIQFSCVYDCAQWIFDLLYLGLSLYLDFSFCG